MSETTLTTSSKETEQDEIRRLVYEQFVELARMKGNESDYALRQKKFETDITNAERITRVFPQQTVETIVEAVQESWFQKAVKNVPWKEVVSGVFMIAGIVICGVISDKGIIMDKTMYVRVPK